MTESQTDGRAGAPPAGKENPTAAHDATSIAQLNDLAWQLAGGEMIRAYALAEQAHTLAGARPDERGLAYSLRTLGILNLQLGNTEAGIAQLVEARARCEACHLDDGLADVYGGLASLYRDAGEMPAALDAAQRQLEVAQRAGDLERTAGGLASLAGVYQARGEPGLALATWQQMLEMARILDHPRLACRAYLGLGESHAAAGDDVAALDDALAALRVSRTHDLQRCEVDALHLLGGCYLRLESAPQAIYFLEQAVELAHTLALKGAEARILLTLGTTLHHMSQFKRAEATLLQALETAQAAGDSEAICRAHEALATFYEAAGVATDALAHFRRFHTGWELLLAERANRQRQVLRLMAELADAAPADAEPAGSGRPVLPAVDAQAALDLSALRERLEQEIEVRTAGLTQTIEQLRLEKEERAAADAETQQAFAVLERRMASRTDDLATLFDLTVLASQATTQQEMLDLALPRILRITRSRSLCVHLLDPHRSALTLVAQLYLPIDNLAALQDVPLDDDLRRQLARRHILWLTTDLARAPGIPDVFRIPIFRTYAGAPIKVGTRAEGLLSCYRLPEDDYTIDEVALVTALAQHLGVLLEVERLRRVARGLRTAGS
ncbi:MAG TPA: hypothetical protein P5333_21355 [Caldilinea sp.]|nr:hypothetical protein [Caldilinea sp.]